MSLLQVLRLAEVNLVLVAICVWEHRWTFGLMFAFSPEAWLEMAML